MDNYRAMYIPEALCVSASLRETPKALLIFSSISVCHYSEALCEKKTSPSARTPLNRS